jgi:hypothetical protein
MPPGHLVPIRFDFKVPHETVAFMCERIRDGAPVLFVSHDEEGEWQFLCGGDHSEPKEGDGATHAPSADPPDEAAGAFVCTPSGSLLPGGTTCEKRPETSHPGLALTRPPRDNGLPGGVAP